MTKILSMLIFTAVLIFFVWQILLGIDNQAKINHDRDCQEALKAQSWVWFNNNCR